MRKIFLFRSNNKINYSSLNDPRLIELYKKKDDPDIIDTLFERYVHLVFSIAIKYLKDEEKARDATMEIFESIGGKLKKHTVNNFKSWLYTLSRNHFLMILRKKDVMNLTRTENDISNSHFVENNAIEHLLNENGSVKINLALSLRELKPEQKRCIELFYLEGKSYKEVCIITGHTEKEVKSHLQNGKRNLKKLIEKKNEEL